MSAEHIAALEAENRMLREQLDKARHHIETLGRAVAPFSAWHYARHRPATGNKKIDERRQSREQVAFIGSSCNEEGERVGATGENLTDLVTECEAALATLKALDKGKS